MLLWGQSGCGKSALAETMPGDKLWLNFDPDGTVALTRKRGAVHVFDFSVYADSIVEELYSPDPFGLDDVLGDHPEVQSVIVDSISTFGDKALHHGVRKLKADPSVKDATIAIDNPTKRGWGKKNVLVNEIVNALCRITGKHKRHIAFTGHEAAPLLNAQGQVSGYTIMLGSSLTVQVPVRISEVWYVSQMDKLRKIAVRPCRLRSPMRTRMFRADSKPEFAYTYDADANTGDGIAEWYEAWKANGFRKIPIPDKIKLKDED
jgi:hypothetical protein